MTLNFSVVFTQKKRHGSQILSVHLTIRDTDSKFIFCGKNAYKKAVAN